MNDKERENLINNCMFLTRRALESLSEVNPERIDDATAHELQTMSVDLYTHARGLAELCR